MSEELVWISDRGLGETMRLRLTASEIEDGHPVGCRCLRVLEAVVGGVAVVGVLGPGLVSGIELLKDYHRKIVRFDEVVAGQRKKGLDIKGSGMSLGCHGRGGLTCS